jgi:hypothetical protein
MDGSARSSQVNRSGGAKCSARAARRARIPVRGSWHAWGVSVFCALDVIGSGSLDGLLQRFASYRVVHLPRAGQLRAVRFDLLASFGRPHQTLQLASDEEPELSRLLEALGPAEANPYDGGKRPGRR